MSALHSTLSTDSLKVADLGRIYEDHAAAPDFLKNLISEIQFDDPITQPRAAYLILRCATDRTHPQIATSKQIETLIEFLPTSTSWISRIQFCQLFARIDCPPEHADILHDQLMRCAADKRTVIRSWAITALLRLGKTHKAYAKDAAAHLRALKSDPSKSAQARLRHLTKHTQPRVKPRTAKPAAITS